MDLGRHPGRVGGNTDQGGVSVRVRSREIPGCLSFWVKVQPLGVVGQAGGCPVSGVCPLIRGL